MDVCTVPPDHALISPKQGECVMTKGIRCGRLWGQSESITEPAKADSPQRELTESCGQRGALGTRSRAHPGKGRGPRARVHLGVKSLAILYLYFCTPVMVGTSRHLGPKGAPRAEDGRVTYPHALFLGGERPLDCLSSCILRVLFVSAA